MDQQINILFIDDDDNLYITYNKLLNANIKENFIFDHIITAEEIEPTIMNQKYDIIVLDQKLNNGNKGLDFLPLIKKNNIYSYVIVNSAYGNERLATEAIRHGANDYIQGNKEDNNEFLKVIQKAINSIKQYNLMEDLAQNLYTSRQKLETKVKKQLNEIKSKIVSRSHQMEIS